MQIKQAWSSFIDLTYSSNLLNITYEQPAEVILILQNNHVFIFVSIVNLLTKFYLKINLLDTDTNNHFTCNWKIID